MKKSRIISKNVRYALIHLYYVSPTFTSKQYEVFVNATKVYLGYIPGTALSNFEKSALDDLSSLVSAFPVLATGIDTKFY